MSREELKEIIGKVIEKVQDEKAKANTPEPACFWGDEPDPCDVTTFYAVGEEN